MFKITLASPRQPSHYNDMNTNAATHAVEKALTGAVPVIIAESLEHGYALTARLYTHGLAVVEIHDAYDYWICESNDKGGILNVWVQFPKGSFSTPVLGVSA